MNESQHQQETMADLLVTEQAFKAYIAQTDAQHNAVKDLEISEQEKDDMRLTYSEHNKRSKRLLSATRQQINELLK